MQLSVCAVHVLLPPLCLCMCPVWRSGTVMASRWWTTCRKPSCCVCRLWICMEPLTLTSGSRARPAGTGSPPQVTHIHTSGILPHTYAHTTLTVQPHDKVPIMVSTLLSSLLPLLPLLLPVSSVHCHLLPVLLPKVRLIS